MRKHPKKQPQQQSSLKTLFAASSSVQGIKRLKSVEFEESIPKRSASATATSTSSCISNKQYSLDFGQRSHIQCSECRMTYTPGCDDKLHKRYHSAFVDGVEFRGWRNERVGATLGNDRIIIVKRGDPAAHIEKVDEVLKYIVRDMGLSNETWDSNTQQVYLYIRNKRVVGCAIAEGIDRAFPLSSDPTDQRKAYVGISVLWCHQNHRKHKIATQLVDAVRCKYCTAVVYTKEQIALSQPTANGKEFGKKYFNSESYLIYN